MPTSFKNVQKICDVCLLAFSLPMTIGGPKMAPRWPQEGAKRAPIRPQERPTALQERPKRGPGGYFVSSRGAGRFEGSPFVERFPSHGKAPREL
eukprot:416244-Pyramimonas_sp.AAC.1